MSVDTERTDRIAALHHAAASRILVLDGSWGAKIQDLRLTEEQFRGERFEGLDDDLHTRTLIAAIVAARQIEELRCEGFDEFHFYTLNQADVVTAVCRLLDLGARVRERQAA